MKTKTLGLFALTILSVVILMGLASAATIFSDNFDDGDLNGWSIINNPVSLPGAQWVATNNYAEAKPGKGSAIPSEGTTTLERTISTSGYQTITLSYDRQLENFELSDAFEVSWSLDGITYNPLEINNTGGDLAFVSKSFNLLPASVEDNANLRLKIDCKTDALREYCRIDNILVQGTIIPPVTPSANICKYHEGVSANNGSLKVDIRDVSVIKNGFGKDKEWLPLDEVEVEIRVKNTGDWDIDDISLEWGIANDDLSSEWVVEFEEVKEFNLKNGKEDTFLVNFKVNEKDLDMNFDEFVGNDYKLVVRATGTIDDNNAGALDTADSCASDSEDDISFYEESDFVILDDIKILPETAMCGSDVQITADVWNIGSDPQDDVYVIIYNQELGLNKQVNIGDIDEFDSENLNAIITLPTNVKEKVYELKVRVYDEYNDIYENDYDEEESEFSVLLEVKGGNCALSSKATVSATLVSGGKAGEDLVISATVINSGTSQATFNLNAAGYSDWASSATLSKTAMVLNAGASDTATITLKIKDDASGDKSFNIEVLSGNAIVVTQPVTVTIEASSPGFFSRITGNAIGGNAYLWGIGILNVILVIVIIIVAVRVAKS